MSVVRRITVPPATEWCPQYSGLLWGSRPQCIARFWYITRRGNDATYRASCQRGRTGDQVAQLSGKFDLYGFNREAFRVDACADKGFDFLITDARVLQLDDELRQAFAILTGYSFSH
jgi:hypothetical protein